MKDLYQTAKTYYDLVEVNRLHRRTRLLHGLVVLVCLTGFALGIRSLLGSLFFGRPGALPYGTTLTLTLLCELLAGVPSIWAAGWNRKRLLEESRRCFPDRTLADVGDVKTLLLERAIGRAPKEFYAAHKEFSAQQAALRASGRSPGPSSGDVMVLIYDPASKPRIWTLLSIFLSVFSALVLAKLTEPRDFVSLLTLPGLKAFGVLLFTAFILVGGALFVAHFMLAGGQATLTWIFSRLFGWGLGRDDVLNYFLGDLLRFGRTQLPDPTTIWPEAKLAAAQEQPASPAEAASELSPIPIP